MSGNDLTLQDACGCCEGVSIQSPAQIHNRPGLSAISYRIGTHSEVLASLLARLSSQDYPELEKLRTRDSDDFSIALLDAYACMADVLSFYQERFANESYLRTADERLSLSELARLISYRLRPGVAAETWLAFTLQEEPPQAESDEPKQASGVPDEVTLEAFIKVQSIPGPDEKPQTFETVENIKARPEWNALKPRLTQTYLPGEGRTDAWFEGTNLNIRPGDGLLFMSGDNSGDTQFRVINAVNNGIDDQGTQVTWALGLDATSLSNPLAYVLRRRAAVFGHNAPRWSTMPPEFKDAYELLSPAHIHSSDWPDFKISPDISSVDMDAMYADVMAGHWVVLTAGEITECYRVAGVHEVARDEFALAAKVTRMTLDRNPASFSDHVRDLTVYTASEALTFSEAPFDDDVVNDSVLLGVAVEGMEEGRKLIVSGRVHDTGINEIEVVTLKLVSPEGDLSRLTFEENLTFSYQRDSVVIYGNVALATHGETAPQTLGSGSARLSHQRFSLSHAPLTYIGADNETGAEAALEVRVNDIRWHEVSSLYGAKPNDRSYVVRVDEEGAAAIQFGDGKRGARLPTGQENVRAVCRKGIGSEGNLQAGQLAQLLSRPLGLKAVSNPMPSAGGVDADSADHARRNMPLGVRTLGRVVSLQDYADYARAYTGIAKAQATVLNTLAGRTVLVTVAGDNGIQPPASTLNKLLGAFKQYGDPLLYCEITAYIEATFHLAMRIKCDADYESENVLENVETALRAAFSFDARDFGQIVPRSEVIAVAQEVAGVVGVDLDSFYRGDTATLEERLTPVAATVNNGNAVAAEILLLDAGPFDSLEEMP